MQTLTSFQIHALLLLTSGEWPLNQLAAVAATCAGRTYRPWQFYTGGWWSQLIEMSTLSGGGHIDIFVSVGPAIQPDDVAMITHKGLDAVRAYEDEVAAHISRERDADHAAHMASQENAP